MNLNTSSPTAQSDDLAARPESLAFDFELPPFSTTATQLVSLLGNPSVEVPRVTELIECEPTIASKVISLANTPIYSPSRPIASVSHAVVILGFRTVTQLVLTAATGRAFCDDDSVCGEAKQKTYGHSLAVAAVARELAYLLEGASADEAFLAGVMHDIGKLVLFNAAGAEYLNIVAAHPDGHTVAQEMDTYGVTHPALGKHCGTQWGLPHSINNAIGSHHDSVMSDVTPLSKTIIVADYFARQWQIGFTSAEARNFDERIESEFDVAALAEARDACEEQFSSLREVCLSA